MKKNPAKHFEIQWRDNLGTRGDTYRVWRSDWGGDQFEVLDQRRFDEV
jgi:hypothetical protein